jgi:hypothetical protein
MKQIVVLKLDGCPLVRAIQGMALIRLKLFDKRLRGGSTKQQ